MTVKLTCTGQLKPYLEVLGFDLVEQRALRVAGVIGFGLATSMLL